MSSEARSCSAGQNSKLKLIVKSYSSGIQTAKDILYKNVDKNTILFLSGGKTPKDLHKIIAEEKKLLPGAVGLVDERFGEKLHDNSNEKMIQDTGFISYLKDRGVSFYPILRLHPKGGSGREETAFAYAETLHGLFSHFKKRVAVLGIGADGHIAGIPAKRFKGCHPEFISGSNSQSNEMLNQVQHDNIEKELLVMEYNDKDGFYKERITMTFKALSEMDLLLVLVFGEEKRQALQSLFTEGPIEEIPARFLRQKGIAEKTMIITDQKV